MTSYAVEHSDVINHVTYHVPYDVIGHVIHDFINHVTSEMSAVT